MNMFFAGGWKNDAFLLYKNWIYVKATELKDPFVFIWGSSCYMAASWKFETPTYAVLKVIFIKARASELMDLLVMPDSAVPGYLMH